MSVNLNPEQMKAVTAPDGPALVLAGAGSGKTRVIVERVVWLIQERGIDPRNILALTFTNKAAGEMKSRISDRLGLERLSSWVGTFHSFGLFMLRREMERLGRPRAFTIFDDSDQLALMKRLVKGLPESTEPVSPREALSWISRLKQDVATPDSADAVRIPADETCRKLWTQYHNALEKAGAVDFDDLLVLPARLLTEHEDVRTKYRARYRHILVDEYQDTNHAQYLIARELAGENGNLLVVGDEDQGIYSWRGASIQNILTFAEEFENAQTYRLEENYRSTKPILDAANAVVANNTERLGKNLWTQQEGGEKVAYYLAGDGNDEALWIAERIAKEAYAPKDTAILYRTNGQARLIEEALLRQGVAYVVVGGVRFYARKEIKDLLCYLRLLVNANDDESLRRIVNVPARGIGSTTLARIEDAARYESKSLFETLRFGLDTGLVPNRAQQAIRDFIDLIDEGSKRAQERGVKAVLDEILEKTGYREFVEKSDEKDFRSRLEVLDEFLNSCADYDAKQRGTVLDFLNDLSLQADTDSLEPGAPAVTLMTCHSAKGLEYDHVFLIGLEEGLLPHGSALNEDGGVEEERRLCYVSMTRARKTLTLTGAATRTMYGEFGGRNPSRFLDEIPETVLHRVNDERVATSRPAPSNNGPKADSAQLAMGVRVRHGRFGNGTVMYTSGIGAKLNVRIRFDTGMTKQFRVSAAPLEILEKTKR